MCTGTPSGVKKKETSDFHSISIVFIYKSTQGASTFLPFYDFVCLIGILQQKCKYTLNHKVVHICKQEKIIQVWCECDTYLLSLMPLINSGAANCQLGVN